MYIIDYHNVHVFSHGEFKQFDSLAFSSIIVQKHVQEIQIYSISGSQRMLVNDWQSSQYVKIIQYNFILITN